MTRAAKAMTKVPNKMTETTTMIMAVIIAKMPTVTMTEITEEYHLRLLSPPHHHALKIVSHAQHHTIATNVPQATNLYHLPQSANL